jgi:hypothetical protein
MTTQDPVSQQPEYWPYSSLFDVSTEFIMKWLADPSSDVQSMSLSGKPSVNTVTPIVPKHINQIPRELFGKWSDLGLISKAMVIRKLLLYLHLREKLFAKMQDTINEHAKDLNRDQACQVVMDLFVDALNKLTTLFEQSYNVILHEFCQQDKIHRRTEKWKLDQLTTFVLENYRSRIKPPDTVAKLIKSLGISHKRIVDLVDKRWKRLDAFRKDHGILPKWIPSEMTNEELITILAGTRKIDGTGLLRDHTEEYVPEIIDLD